MRTRIIGVCSCMKTFDFFYGIRLGELVLKHSDNISKTLQSPHLSAAEAPKIVAMTLKTLESLREDDKIWTRTVQISEDFGVHEPDLPRKRRAPRRLEVGESEGHCIDDVKTHYRVTYYGAIESITTCFEQPGYRVYSKLETLLLKAATYTDELEFVGEFIREISIDMYLIHS